MKDTININSNNYEKKFVGPNCVLIKPLNPQQDDFATEISYGLTRKKKFIPSKYFYDANGSRLFEEICDLDEYYLTKKELEILSTIKDEMPKYFSQHSSVVELGSGSSIKTRHLFELLLENHSHVKYYPIDISDIVQESSERLQDEFTNLHITGIIDHYEAGLKLLKNLDDKKIIVFFGSSFGNFDHAAGLEFLNSIKYCMKKDDLFLLGIDLVKDTKILEKAYDDSKGVTKNFNLNLLKRINAELRGNFDLKKFEHRAFFNARESRIEMHLESKVQQQVYLENVDLQIKLEKGEMIRTEYSHKYTLHQIRQIASKSGFKISKIWQDKQKYFALILFSTT
ncbi:MAG: L-histidine N(alpha)-methyltransferase [Thaumarchaeota archaeon]|nr:L-histidine N(alpha)-methyltransferase [Nitrososphaerota archaeon]